MATKTLNRSVAFALPILMMALVAGPVQAQDFSGVYTSLWGDITIEQSGEKVTGTYTKGNLGSAGTIRGELYRYAPDQPYFIKAEYKDGVCTEAFGGCEGTVSIINPYYPDEPNTLEFQYTPSYTSSFTRLWLERHTAGDPVHGKTPPPSATPITDLPLGGNRPPERNIPLSSDRIRVPGGDAGTNNSEAAAIRYNCRIDGALARGDYDAYAFEFGGGTFRAHSESDLDLVADLIRASDGEVLGRSGVDTTAFTFDGPLEAGRYILQVRVMRHAGAGPYHVILGNPGGCVVEETASASAQPVTSGPGPSTGGNLALNKPTDRVSSDVLSARSEACACYERYLLDEGAKSDDHRDEVVEAMIYDPAGGGQCHGRFMHPFPRFKSSDGGPMTWPVEVPWSTVMEVCDGAQAAPLERNESVAPAREENPLGGLLDRLLKR